MNAKQLKKGMMLAIMGLASIAYGGQDYWSDLGYTPEMVQAVAYPKNEQERQRIVAAMQYANSEISKARQEETVPEVMIRIERFRDWLAEDLPGRLGGRFALGVMQKIMEEKEAAAAEAYSKLPPYGHTKEEWHPKYTGLTAQPVDDNIFAYQADKGAFSDQEIEARIQQLKASLSGMSGAEKVEKMTVIEKLKNVLQNRAHFARMGSDPEYRKQQQLDSAKELVEKFVARAQAGQVDRQEIERLIANFNRMAAGNMDADIAAVYANGAQELQAVLGQGATEVGALPSYEQAIQMTPQEEALEEEAPLTYKEAVL